MPDHRRTRVAFAVAAAVLASSSWAPRVTAGTVTIDWPACAAPRLTGTGPYTISCGGSACTATATTAGGAAVNPAVPVSANSTVSLNVQCSPAAATAANTTWVASRDCANPSSGLPASVSDAGKLCTYSANVSANGEVMRADVSVLWAAGTVVTPPPPPPPPPPGGGFCSSFTDVRYATLNWGSQLSTEEHGHIAAGGVYVAQFTVPAGTVTPQDAKGSISMIEYGVSGPRKNRVVSLSTQPCDFRGYNPPIADVWSPLPTDPSGTNNPLAWRNSSAPDFTFRIPGDPVDDIVLTPGVTYYLNIRTIAYSTGANVCTTTYCDMKFTPRLPY